MRRIQRAVVGIGLGSALILGAAATAPAFVSDDPDADRLLGEVLEDESDEDDDVDERFGTDDDSDGRRVLEVGDISVILEGVEVLGLDLGSDDDGRHDDDRHDDDEGVLEVLLERVLGGLVGGADDDDHDDADDAGEDIEDQLLGDGLGGGPLRGR